MPTKHILQIDHMICMFWLNIDHDNIVVMNVIIEIMYFYK